MTREVPILRAKGLKKRYGSNTVVPGLDLELPDIEGRSEIIAMLGPSGCGKSTILRMVAGLEEPSAGSLEVLGMPVRGPGEHCGMIFQKYSSFPFLTVLDNIAWPLIHVRGMARKAARELAQVWAQKMYLADAVGRYPHQLSGGMQQRVAIARTLCMQPRLVLMDEPFGALDRKIRWEMQDLLVEILFTKPEREYTVIIVTHDIPEAVFLADTVWLINKGLIASTTQLPRATEAARNAQARPDFLQTVNNLSEELDGLRI